MPLCFFVTLPIVSVYRFQSSQLSSLVHFELIKVSFESKLPSVAGIPKSGSRPLLLSSAKLTSISFLTSYLPEKKRFHSCMHLILKAKRTSLRTKS